MEVTYSLLKLRTLDKEHLLIEDRYAKEDTLYLFVFPRTSNAPYFGAMCLYVEAVLTWKGIPFHRISNQFFLGSKTDGAIPFAIYNGKYLDGAEKIIEEVRKKGNKKLSDEHDDNIRKFATRTLLKTLIADRTSRRDLPSATIPKNNSETQLTSSSLSNSAPATPKGGISIKKKFSPIDIKIPHAKNEEIMMARSEGHSPGSSFLSRTIAHLKLHNNNSPKKGPGGLDWMLTDEGVREQLIPVIPEAFLDPEIQINISKEESMSDEFFDSPVKDKNEKKSKKEEEDDESDETKISKIKYSIKMTLSPELWKDYFNILNKIKINGRENREEINLLKINFLQEYFGVNARIYEDWERVNYALKNTINDILKKLIVDSQMPFCWEKRLREITGKNINEVEVFNEFKDKMKSLGIIKKLTEAEAKTEAEGKNNFLHGNNPTLADFALFAFLNQFFEFPLNIPEFKELFTPEKLSNEEKELIAKRKGETENSIKINGNLFKNYIKRVKNILGKFGDDEVWRMMKQRPWPLNFKLIEEEENEIFGDKYEGPFNIEVGELTNIHTLLDINNAENFLSDESSQLKKELKKKGWWSDPEYSLNNNKIEKETEAGPSETLKGKEISTEETNDSKLTTNLQEAEASKEIKKEKSKLFIMLNKDKQKDLLIKSPKEGKSPKMEKQKIKFFQNEIVLFLIEKIFQKLINKYLNEVEIQKIFGKLIILEMAAFICNLGKNNKLIGKDFYECKEKHEKIEKNYLNENEEFFENYFGEKEEERLFVNFKLELDPKPVPNFD
ncbi:unnamed protein product [Meloidogyne enterolobii]|uniref:Uncharacterized protein n=1 Tax=Meloidogyne enterolobii TaxID=390850 RepID=A0ACB0Y4Q3_MELEN